MLKYTAEYIEECLTNRMSAELINVLEEARERDQRSYRENIKRLIGEEEFLILLIKKNMSTVIQAIIPYPSIGDSFYLRENILFIACTYVTSKNMLAALRPILDQFIKDHPDALVADDLVIASNPLAFSIKNNNAVMTEYILESFSKNYSSNAFKKMFKTPLKTNNKDIQKLLYFYGSNLIFILNENPMIDTKPFNIPNAFKDLINDSSQTTLYRNKQYWKDYLTHILNDNKSNEFVSPAIVLLDQLNDIQEHDLPIPSRQLAILERISFLLHLEEEKLHLDIINFKNKFDNIVRRSNDAVLNVKKSNRPIGSLLYVVFLSLMITVYVYWMFHSLDLTKEKHNTRHDIFLFCNNNHSRFNHCIKVPTQVALHDYHCNTTAEHPSHTFNELYAKCYNKKIEHDFSFIGLAFYSLFILFYFIGFLQTLSGARDRFFSSDNFYIMKTPSRMLKKCIGSYNAEMLIQDKQPLINQLKEMISIFNEFYLSGQKHNELIEMLSTLDNASNSLKPEDLIQLMKNLHHFIGNYGLRIHFLPESFHLPEDKLNKISLGLGALNPDHDLEAAHTTRLFCFSMPAVSRRYQPVEEHDSAPSLTPL